ncbi:preprotein translocase subunit SecY [bacterium]|nr:preprotein translocase subunit SecY [bacterium]
MLQTIRNAFAIKDLRDRILFTILMMAVFRIGSYIPCPFINVGTLQESFGNLMGNLMGVANMFTGGAFSKMTVMSLGIMPYITASIILQLLMIVVPQLEKMSKEGESGRKKITQYTRYGTVALALAQGFGMAMFIRSQPEWITPFMRDRQILFVLLMMLTITTGTTFLMWIGEKITERGIGNGVSLVITVGIATHYLPHIMTTLDYVKNDDFPPIFLLIVAALCIAATILIVLVQEGNRKIPIQHAKQASGRKMQAAQTNYLPLKINTAGVMPVIFSSAILTLPATIFGWIGAAPGEGLGFIGELFALQSRYNLYNMLNLEAGSIFLLLKAVNLHTIAFIILTAGFCFFYTAIVFNPQDVADNLRRVGAFVPGYRPGPQTANYIDKVMTRITLVGAVFLCVIAIFPQILMVSFDLPFELADFAGGTGLIIVVAVVLDTMKQIESRVLMRHYDGFKSRRQQSGSPGSRRWSAPGSNK